MNYYGNVQLLNSVSRSLVLYMSRNYPSIYETELETFYRSILDYPLVLVSGWQSPFEKRMLHIALQLNKCSIIFISAKSLSQNLAYFKKLFSGISTDRFLVIDPGIDSPRISRQSVQKREQFILDNFHHFLFPYISPGGYCEQIFQKCVALKKNIFLFQHEMNKHYFWDSVTPIDPFTMDVLSCLDILNSP